MINRLPMKVSTALGAALVMMLTGCPTPEAVDGGGAVSSGATANATRNAAAQAEEAKRTLSETGAPPKDAAARAEQAMRALAAKDAPKGVESAIESGPMGIQVARAMRVGAYPGTGVFRVLVVDGVTYGKRGDRDLADLARARGWHKKPPIARELLRVVSAAQHDGMLAPVSSAEHTVRIVDGDVVLKAILGEPFGKSRYDFTVTLPAKGPLTSTKTLQVTKASKPAEAKPSPAAALTAALASHDSMDILDAVKALKGSSSPQRYAPLAAAAVLDNDRIATSALAILGSDDQALAALAKAAASLSPAQRSTLIKRTEATLGRAASTRLAK